LARAKRFQRSSVEVIGFRYVLPLAGQYGVLETEQQNHHHAIAPSEQGGTAVDAFDTVQSLIAVLAGLRVPFLCTETEELGTEIVASYLYQVHLYHWLETNDHGRFLAGNDL
jgi:hypothetical protein